MIISLFTFLLTLTFAADAVTMNSTAHEYHNSKCQIEYSEPDKALQITLYIFIDDLEDALRERGADKLFIATEREHKKAEKHIYAYLQDKLELNVNEQKVDFTFIGKEPSEDLQAIWCYLEVPDMKEINELFVSNSILMEVFDDQKNIVSVVGPNNKRGYFLFEVGKSSESIRF